ncbi:hypothetical protein O181_014990 [Austropuccinia psidii MF-1]|uniref:Uncharacterized protein n=1 Tax=Austropuccinia psidii MF-1 TaxID=1389203 RepID=A0A9Q3C2Z8_9BASI|nr:hypothetical protein [Austropuccinia psidii MF-1]
MSKEDQINLILYANLFTSLKILFIIQYLLNPYVKSISTASTGFYLLLVLRSSPFKVGRYCPNHKYSPPNGCWGNSGLNPVYVQLAISPFYWSLMGPNLIYGLRPYAAFISLVGQFSTSPTPRPLSFSLGLGGLFGLPGPMAALTNTRSLGPTPYIMGVLAFLRHLGPLWPLQPIVRGNIRPLLDPIQ